MKSSGNCCCSPWKNTNKTKKSAIVDTHPAHKAGEHKCSLCCRLLIVALGLLHLCLLLGIFVLTLNLLMPARHSGKTWGEAGRENDLEFPDSHQCHQIVSTQTQSGAMASFTVTLEDFCRPSTMTEKESEFCDVWNRELGNEQSAQGRHT